jgi:hypothetical protein
MRGLDPRIHQKKKRFSKKMDCRIEPGNDERTSEPVFANQHVIAPPCALAGREEQSDQALTPAPIGHDTPVPPSPQ